MKGLQNKLYEAGGIDQGLFSKLGHTLTHPLPGPDKAMLTDYWKTRYGVDRAATPFSDITSDANGNLYKTLPSGEKIYVSHMNLLDPKDRAAVRSILDRQQTLRQ